MVIENINEVESAKKNDYLEVKTNDTVYTGHIVETDLIRDDEDAEHIHEDEIKNHTKNEIVGKCVRKLVDGKPQFVLNLFYDKYERLESIKISFENKPPEDVKEVKVNNK